MRFSIALLATGISVSSPAMAIDACLLGTWDADLDDMAHVMATQMNGSAAVSSGRVSMQILPDGDTTLLADDLVFKVLVPGVPEMDVKVVGYSNGTMSTTDGAWTLTVGSYDLVGSADVMGQTLTIPFTSATGIFGGGLGIYGCRAGSASFESTGDTPRMPRRWTR